MSRSLKRIVVNAVMKAGARATIRCRFVLLLFASLYTLAAPSPVEAQSATSTIPTATPSATVASNHQSDTADKKAFASRDATVGLIGALAGALASLFGVWLTEKANRKRDEAEEHRRRKSLRVLILQEVDHNVRMVQEQYQRGTNIPPGREDVSQLDRLSLIPSPTWNTSIWHSQAAASTVAFEPEELHRIQEFYFTLGRVSDLWRNLNETRNDRTIIVGSDLQDLLEKAVADAIKQGTSLRDSS